jgi:hypothetical protein
MNFILLPPDRFIEFGFPSGKEETLTLLARLNAAHFDFNIDSLWWLGQPRGAA